MRYIKLYEYFEDNNFVNTLQDFCDANLAFLIDDNFRVNTDEEFAMKNRKVISITISKCDFFKYQKSIKGSKFNYDDIKDDFIPFSQLLLEKYPNYDYDVRFLTININQKKNSDISDTIINSSLLPYKENVFDMNDIINDTRVISMEIGLITAIEIMVM